MSEAQRKYRFTHTYISREKVIFFDDGERIVSVTYWVRVGSYWLELKTELR